MSPNSERFQPPKPCQAIGTGIGTLMPTMPIWIFEAKSRAVSPSRVKLFRAPGAFEVPLACQLLLESRFDGVVALGAVIRGDTPHFDFVAGECSRGLMDVQLKTGKPLRN